MWPLPVVSSTKTISPAPMWRVSPSLAVIEIPPTRLRRADSNDASLVARLVDSLLVELSGSSSRYPLAYLRRFEHFKGSKCLILLRWTPEGRHYSGVGGAGALAVILGGGWAGSSSFSLFSKRLSSGSGSV